MLKSIANFCLTLSIVMGLLMPGAIASPTDVIYLKLAGLSHVPASRVDEVIGFGYIEPLSSEPLSLDSTRQDLAQSDSGSIQACQARYEALPPHFGMLQFVEMAMDCPTNLRAIASYQIDYKQAIEHFHQLDCGDAFKAMSLQWSRDNIDNEPLWTFLTNIDTTVTIGANSGTATCLPTVQP